jgi:hypothetical protein
MLFDAIACVVARRDAGAILREITLGTTRRVRAHTLVPERQRLWVDGKRRSLRLGETTQTIFEFYEVDRRIGAR